MENIKKRLYIPVNISREKEILSISGIHKKELLMILISAVLGLFIGLYIGLKYGQYILVIFPILFMIAFAFMIVRKDKTHRNTVDRISQVLKFNTEQKRYIYRHKNMLDVRDMNVNEK